MKMCFKLNFKTLNYLSTELEISVKWIKVNWSVEIRIHETEKYEVYERSESTMVLELII